jgi:hypothetical protein
LIVVLVGANAHGEPLKPVTSHTGWQYDVDTFLQVDGVPWTQASQDQLAPTGDVLNEETMTIRRALLRVIGHKDDFRALVEFVGDTVGGTPQARLLEGILGWAPRGELVDVEAGLMQIPFGMETQINVRKRVFMEQPTFLRAFFPGDNDAGTMVKGAYGMLRWSAAAMNGAPVKDTQWKGRDPSSSYDLIARVGGDLALDTVPGLPHVTVGVSALSGESLHPGVAPTKDHLVWVDENMDGLVQASELTDIAGTPGEPSQKYRHNALGADAKVAWCLQWAGAGEAFFEGAIATNLDRAVYFADPIANARDLRELGLELGVVQHVTANALAGVRYDRYDADRDASAQLGTTLVGVHRVFSTWAFLAAVQRGTARLSFEYDRVKNPLGRADNGMPATIGDDRFIIRAQAEF